MKKHMNFISPIVIGFYFLMLICCHKDKGPQIYGDWETLSVVGFKWEYSIAEKGQFCKQLPEYFPETSFCYGYRHEADTTFIDAPEPEKWLWEFEGDNIAVITNLNANGGQPQQFILRRRK